MNILNKLAEIFKKNIMFYIKIAPPDNSPKNNKIEEIYFKGAWEEDGEARWVFFKTEDEHATARLKPSVITEDIYATARLKEEPSFITENTSDIETLKTSGITENTYVTAEDKIPANTDFKTILFNKTIIEEDKKETITLHEAPVELEKEEVVSITKLGYKMTSRYSSSVSPADNQTKNELIDQRDIMRDEKIKVFFAEDNKSFQLVLKTLLNYSQDTELCGWASNGEEALQKIRKLSPFPDVILMDIAMPRMDGISATKELLKINPHASIIMLTAFGDKEHVVDAFESGASGFLRKDAPLPLVEEAIKQAARGGRPVYKEISEYVKDVKKTCNNYDCYDFPTTTNNENLYSHDPSPITANASTVNLYPGEVHVHDENLIYVPEKDCKEIYSDTKPPSDEEKITKKIEVVEKVIQKVERNKDILDEIIKKIEEKEKNTKREVHETEAVVEYEKGTLTSGEIHKIDKDNEITQKILYYKSLLREKPEQINDIIKAFRELQKKYPENMDLCISLAIACFKQNLFKEGLEECAKTIENREFLKKKSIQKIINYDIILQQPLNPLSDVSDTINKYDITDELWEKIKPMIPVRKKKSGYPPMEDRKAMNAILYILQTGCPWKLLPRSLGAGSTVHNRFMTWKKSGLFKDLLSNGIIDCNLKNVINDNCKRRHICF
ncbi:MAG: transposase [Candidatus Eremiobacterota bacterium]